MGALGFSLMSCNASQIYPIDELLGRTEPPFFGEGFRLRKKAADAFIEMQAAALQKGIDMYSQSSYRSYSSQEGIWTRKYNAFTKGGMAPIKSIEKIIEYSTIPGTSRHHWGTDLDITDKNKPTPSDPLLAKHFEKGGVYESMKKWLNENAEAFGFYEVYTNAPDRKGFKYEPWHFSYKPLSQVMLKEYKEIDLKALLQQMKLIGSEHFTDDFVGKYRKENVFDINKELL